MESTATSVEEELHDAIRENHVARAKEILRQSPQLDINWENPFDYDGLGRAALHSTCQFARHDLLVLLLAHPDINVGKRDGAGSTAFMAACHAGNPAIVRRMLVDARVQVNEPDDSGRTPLHVAAHWGHVDAIKWIIVSGRHLELGESGSEIDALGEARKKGHGEVVAVLEKFKRDRALTMKELRRELGVHGELLPVTPLSSPPPLVLLLGVLGAGFLSFFFITFTMYILCRFPSG